MKPTDSIEVLHGVGPSLARKMAAVQIRTIRDLLEYYPRDYHDYSEVIPLSDIRPGPVTVKGTFKQISGRYVRRGMHITEAILSDASNSVRVVWFNQPYRAQSLKTTEVYFVSGNFELSRQRMQIMNPTAELVSSFPVHTARIVPVYKQTKSLKSTEIRNAIKAALQAKTGIETSLPHQIETTYSLIPKQTALTKIHFPSTAKDVEQAKKRLGFEEIFELITAHLVMKNEASRQQALAIPFKVSLAKKFVHNLPFKLTNAQKLSVWEAYQDIARDTPMNRLIEGDVGSGKTVIAAMLTAMVAAQGYQTAFMAPTEILARQHAQSMTSLLEPLGQADGVCLLIGSMNAKQKKVAYDRILDGSASCIIGTHALIQERVDMHALALVIVDEQHRFGVEQRKQLLKKAGHMPHMLSMTATPIPRSLALTVYGDVDISILNEKPPGRKPVATKIIEHNHRISVYEKVKTRVQNGEQAFVVCPVIDEQATGQIKSVTKVHTELSAILEGISVGLLHGKMSAEKKQQTMQAFIDNKIQILVSTTVIEVGVDVPNTTIMCIEAPERFGLAQIHQLRGRVGRGELDSICYLFLSENAPPSRRLRAIEQTNDGFALAELDLELRGPGAIYGTSQHGALDLRLVNFTDTTLIKQARDAAQTIIKEDKNLVQYPVLRRRIQTLQKIVHLN